MKKLSNMLHRIPLTPKMLLLTVLVGVVVWGILDYAQSKKLRALIEASMTTRLIQRAQNDRIRFDNYVGAYQQSVKLIVSQKSFVDYVLSPITPVEGKIRVKRHTEVPPWLPNASVLRKFSHIHYALLIDAEGRVREVYQGWPEPLPATLLRPSGLLVQMSHNQSFMTYLDGHPYLLTSDSILGRGRRPLATLILIANLDDDFLISSQGLITKTNIVALAEGDNSRIIASNRPDVIPAGTPLASLTKDYLVTGKSFFDWGGSDVILQFMSFIPRSEYEQLNASILSAERLQRAIVFFSLLLAFAIIMLWITRHIRILSRDITNFSQDVLGIKHQTIQQGDELFLIESQFGNMTEEIINARDALKKEAEEKVVLLRKAMEAERQERELKLLQALKLSEENYRSIFDSANDAIFVHDMRTGAVLEVNKKMTEMYGYSAEEAKTLTVGALSAGEYPYNQDGAVELIGKAVRGELQLFEWLAKDKFGRTFWVEVNLKGAAIGGSDRILAIVRDITERKRTEQRLAVQYTVTRILAEATSPGEATPRILQSICEHVGWELGEVWLVDAASPALRLGGVWNVPFPDFGEFNAQSRTTVFERGIGLPGRVWAEGRPAWITDVVTDSDFPRAALTAAAGLHAGFAFPIRSEGEVIGVMDFFSRGVQPPDDDLLRMFDALGSQIGDFIKRKKAEESLVRYSGELERSNKELQMFASIASHDLQEPLRVVSGFAKLLERRYKGGLDKKADDFIRFIVDGTVRMQQLIRDLLDYSRVTTQGNPFKPADCDLVMQRALINLKAAVEESKAVITADPLPVVMADESQLVHLFQNLIGNAVKYRGEQEQPRVHISASRLDDPSVYAVRRREHVPNSLSGPSALKKGWLFLVRDNGIGIEPKHFDRIFEVFQRLHASEKYPGTGIGLAICKKIVERHGGGIWVTSEPGKGSTFHFTIPERAEKDPMRDQALEDRKADP